MSHRISPLLVLLDRDGVINRDLPQGVQTPDEFVLIPKTAAAIRSLNLAGVKVVVITNQALVGRKEIDETDLHKIHQHMERLLAQEGAKIDDLFYCIDTEVHPNQRRKPAPGMLLEALEKYQADPSITPMIGDALRDLEAAQVAGCLRYLVKTGKGQATVPQIPQSLQPVHIFEDLWDAALHYLDER